MPLLLSGFALHVAQLCLWLVLLTVVFVPLERLFSAHPQRVRRREIGVDVCYYFLNSLLPAALMALPMALLTAVAQRVLPTEWLRLVHSLPLWAAIACAVVLADFGSYWAHRMCHSSPWLWRFHAIHHSAEQIYFLVNTRTHPLDMVWTRMCALLPVTLFGMTPSSASGALLPAIVAIVGTLAGFFVHANLRWRLGPLEWCISSPAFHHWHHSRIDHINHNFAATFPWIDRLFGTHYLPDKEWPVLYGLEQPLPPQLAEQLIAPCALALAIHREQGRAASSHTASTASVNSCAAVDVIPVKPQGFRCSPVQER